MAIGDRSDSIDPRAQHGQQPWPAQMPRRYEQISTRSLETAEKEAVSTDAAIVFLFAYGSTRVC